MRQLFAVLAVALLAVSLWGGAEPASVEARHSWGRYHWARTSNPFTIQLGDNVSEAWDFYLREASSSPSLPSGADHRDWSESSVLDTVVVGGSTSPETCTPTSGRIEVCSYAYGDNGWLGLAQVWAFFTTGHIVQGTAQMNDTYFNTSTYNTPAWRHLVMCQEIAHAFGLDHQDERFTNRNLGSCMDYTNDPDGPPSNERPNQHDYDQLVRIYGHLDSTTTVGQSSAGDRPGRTPILPDEVGKTPAQWGVPVRAREDRRPILYQRDLGADRVLFTWVIWADHPTPLPGGR
jgi:hypothetical protein